MREVKYLAGRELDYWVARAAGWTHIHYRANENDLYGYPPGGSAPRRLPCYTGEADAYLEMVDLFQVASRPIGDGFWAASLPLAESVCAEQHGHSLPVAAARAVVATRMGPVVADCPARPELKKESWKECLHHAFGRNCQAEDAWL